MNKLELKEQIIQKALETYRERMQSKRDKQMEILEDTNKFGNEDFEMSDEANREEAMERVEERAKIMDQMDDNLQNIVRAVPTLQSEVGIGTVVITDMQNFFIGANIPNFEVRGTNYTGISPDAPIYQELRGKKPGEELCFRDRDYHIKEVF